MRYTKVGSGYRRTKPKPVPDLDVNWAEIDYVVGTRDDVTRTGISRPCTECGHAVFTSRHYPAEVAMICEVCALRLAEEEHEQEKKERKEKSTKRATG